jgi:glycosyltransferase involved in cell wall biosynthesis
MKKISCLVPAYNEGPRIRNVLEILHDHPLINEVLVIDDCSKDNTSQEASGFSDVRVIRHEINQGKSRAIVTGLKEARNEYVMFIDADLVGLTKENITALVQPVAEDKADVSISLRGNTPRFWKWLGLDYISGERVLPRDFLLSHVDDITRLRRFGLETYMNTLIVAQKYRIKVVHWDNVASPYKYTKDGLFQGVKSDVRMMGDIFHTVNPIGILILIVKMMALRV